MTRQDRINEARKIFEEEPILKWSYIDKCQWAMSTLIEENEKLRNALEAVWKLVSPDIEPEEKSWPGRRVKKIVDEVL